jgi:hypothetical protein
MSEFPFIHGGASDEEFAKKIKNARETIYTANVKESALLGIQEGDPITLTDFGVVWVRTISEPNGDGTRTIKCSSKRDPIYAIGSHE